MTRLNSLIAAFAILITACNSVDPPDACYTVDKTIAMDKSTVFSFTDCSENAESYSWDFGDGTGSSEANPEHSFVSYGEFEVTLTIENETGENTFTEEIFVGKPRLVSGKVISYKNTLSESPQLFEHGYSLVNSGHVETLFEYIYGSPTGIFTTNTGDAHFHADRAIQFYYEYALDDSGELKSGHRFVRIGSFEPDLLTNLEYSGVEFNSYTVEGNDTIEFKVDMTFELDPTYTGS